MAWMTKAKLVGANLKNANLQEAKLNGATLENAIFTGVRKHYASFQATYMDGCTDCPFNWAK